MRWRSDHWSIPFALVTIVWTPIFLAAYQTGGLSNALHRMDSAGAAADPRGLSPATQYALMQLEIGDCDWGASVLDWVARGPSPPPDWTQGKVFACLEDAGRDEEATDRLVAHCATRPPSESEVVPAFRVNPLYPERARAAGAEGYVEVSFDLLEDGRVHSPEVEISEPPGVFDEAAILAIREWRYCPGSELEDVRVRLTFELEEEAPQGI